MGKISVTRDAQIGFSSCRNVARPVQGNMTPFGLKGRKKMADFEGQLVVGEVNTCLCDDSRTRDGIILAD